MKLESVFFYLAVFLWLWYSLGLTMPSGKEDPMFVVVTGIFSLGMAIYFKISPTQNKPS